MGGSCVSTKRRAGLIRADVAAIQVDQIRVVNDDAVAEHHVGGNHREISWKCGAAAGVDSDRMELGEG